MLNEITKGLLNEEIKKCMEIFRGNKGGCSFNNGSSCNNCGAVSLLHKLLHGVVDHRPIRELYPEIKIKKEKKTIEYVESMKELLKIYETDNIVTLVTKIQENDDKLIKEGRNSRTYILIEEMLENKEEFNDCLFIIFNKDDIDTFMNMSEGTPIQFFKRFINVVDGYIFKSGWRNQYGEPLIHNVDALPHYNTSAE